MIVAIDGPAGAGKSTTARALARRLGYAFINTGAMYRAVALAATEAGLRWPQDQEQYIDVARTLRVSMSGSGERIFIDGRDVTELLYTSEIAELTSAIATLEPLRAVVTLQQRELAERGNREQGGAVLEGRDIQTVVCPNAEVKVFLTADTATRARRRQEEWAGGGNTTTTLESAQASIASRDERDMLREVAPLRAAPDAIVLSTDDLGPDEVVERLAALVAAHRETTHQP